MQELIRNHFISKRCSITSKKEKKIGWKRTRSDFLKPFSFLMATLYFLNQLLSRIATNVEEQLFQKLHRTSLMPTQVNGFGSKLQEHIYTAVSYYIKHSFVNSNDDTVAKLYRILPYLWTTADRGKKRHVVYRKFDKIFFSKSGLAKKMDLPAVRVL